MASADPAAVYKKGSLAALRAERANKKLQEESKKNIIMPSPTPTVSVTATPSTDNKDKRPSLSVNANAQPLNVEENKNELSVPSNGSSHSQENSGYIDEHGFFLSEEEKQKKLAELDSEAHRAAIRKQNERIYKWLHMLDNWDTYTTTKKAKLKSRVRKGIPAPLRAKVWKKIIGVSELTKEERHYYARIRYQPPVAKFKSSIDNDLDRTFPRHILFTKEDAMSTATANASGKTCGRGKESLRNVLYAYANHDTDVGYTQGMGFIAALFLMLMTEDDAFYCMVKLLDQNGDFAMRGLYLDGLPLLHMRYYQFDQLMLKFMPKVYEHVVEKHNIMPALYASKWFITVFCYEFPFEYVYRIWDIYLNEGIKFVFRVALAMIKMNEHEILKLKSFDNLMKFMQSLHEHCPSIEVLLSKAFDLALKHEHLGVIEEQYNRKKLHESREKRQRGGRRGRGDVSEMEQPAFLKSLSAQHTPVTPYTPNSSNANDDKTPLPITPNDHEEEKIDLNHLYKSKRDKEKDESTEHKEESSQEASKKEESGSKRKHKHHHHHHHHHQQHGDKETEGSHSASSYVEDEPSSLLPHDKEHGHEPIAPSKDESPPPQANGHSVDNDNGGYVD